MAEELLAKLIPALIRAGSITGSVILHLADDIDAEAEGETITRGEELQNMAAALRIWAMEASGPTRSELIADNRRKRFRVIKDKP